jgi:glyoxylase-like metal-dependent hydrolase (beta-lactamase superfamily II)
MSHPFKLAVVPVTPYQQNCSILLCTQTGRSAVVDPGGDVERIRQALAQVGGTVEKILLTHGHIDHAGGAAELAEALGVPVEGPHRADKLLLDNLPLQGAQMGAPGSRALTPDRWLEEGETVTVGAQTFDILHCPGHSPGSVVFVWRRPPAEPGQEALQGFALMGDVLFRGSVGRTDLPGGSHEALITAIKTKILPLGDDVAFLPGHGPMSTIGEERVSNPFLL